MTRDQMRALHAYDCIGRVPPNDRDRKNYKIAINDLGANILRGGLCAALAAVQRLEDRRNPLLQHLASAGVPGLTNVKPDHLAKRVRRMGSQEYMIATREMLQVAMWLKRAAQATFGDH